MSVNQRTAGDDGIVSEGKPARSQGGNDYIAVRGRVPLRAQQLERVQISKRSPGHIRFDNDGVPYECDLVQACSWLIMLPTTNQPAEKPAKVCLSVIAALDACNWLSLEELQGVKPCLSLLLWTASGAPAARARAEFLARAAATLLYPGTPPADVSDWLYIGDMLDKRFYRGLRYLYDDRFRERVGAPSACDVEAARIFMALLLQLKPTASHACEILIGMAVSAPRDEGDTP